MVNKIFNFFVYFKSRSLAMVLIRVRDCRVKRRLRQFEQHHAQKKNPTALETVQQRVALGIGYLASTLGALRVVGTVRSENIETLTEALDMAEEILGLMASILEMLEVHEDRVKELSSAS